MKLAKVFAFIIGIILGIVSILVVLWIAWRVRPVGLSEKETILIVVVAIAVVILSLVINSLTRLKRIGGTIDKVLGLPDNESRGKK